MWDMWVAVLFVAVLVALQVAGWRAMARKDFRRVGGAGLSALHEIVEPHTAEHQRLEVHAADVDEDDDGDGGDRRRRARPPGLAP
jgi:hypothetical protein